MGNTVPSEEQLLQARMSYQAGTSFADFNFRGTIFDAARGFEDLLEGVVNADILLDRKLEAEAADREEREKDRQQEMLEEVYRRSRENAVRFNGENFEMFGMEIAEEDMDAAIEATLSDYDAFVQQQGMSAAEAAAFYQHLIAYRNAADPTAKAEALEGMIGVHREGAAAVAKQAEQNEQRRAAHEAPQTETAAFSEPEAAELAESADSVGGGLMFADTREGPVITDRFTEASVGTTPSAAPIHEVGMRQQLLTVVPS